MHVCVRVCPEFPPKYSTRNRTAGEEGRKWVGNERFAPRMNVEERGEVAKAAAADNVTLTY